MDVSSGGLDNGLYALGGGGVVWLAQMLWTKIFSTEGKANDVLVSQLAERLTAMESRQTKLEADLDEERRLRRKAEDKVHALELDNLQLRAVLKAHSIDVPTSFVVHDLPPEPPASA